VWLIPLPVMLPMRVYVAIIGAIAFFGSLGATGDNISHISHLGGMLVGYMYLRRGSYLFRVRNRFTDWQRRRARRKFEVYQRQHREEPPRRPDDWVN
jgi:membrane associated rhomboid family serine protease